MALESLTFDLMTRENLTYTCEARGGRIAVCSKYEHGVKSQKVGVRWLVM